MLKHDPIVRTVTEPVYSVEQVMAYEPKTSDSETYTVVACTHCAVKVRTLGDPHNAKQLREARQKLITLPCTPMVPWGQFRNPNIRPGS